MRSIAIAGATALVGRHVVSRLLEEPDLALRCLVRSQDATGALTALGEGVSCTPGDIREAVDEIRAELP